MSSLKRKHGVTSPNRVKKSKQGSNEDLFPFVASLQDDNSFDFKELKKECLGGNITDNAYKTKLVDLAKKFKFLGAYKRLKANDFKGLCKVVDEGIRFSSHLAKSTTRKGKQSFDSIFDQTVAKMVAETTKKELEKVKKVKNCDSVTNPDDKILCKLEHSKMNQSDDKKLNSASKKFYEQSTKLQKYAINDQIPSDKELAQFKETTLKLEKLTSKKYKLKQDDYQRINDDLKKASRFGDKIEQKRQQIREASKSKGLTWRIISAIGSGFSQIASFIAKAVQIVWNTGAGGQVAIVTGLLSAFITCFIIPQTFTVLDPGWFSTQVISVQTTPCLHLAQQFFSTVILLSKSASWAVFWQQLVPILTIASPFISRLI